MKTMFSDDVLRDVRKKLLARGTLLRERIEHVRTDLLQENDPRLLASNDPVSSKENDQVLAAVQKAAYAEMSRIESALDRMEEGTFGLCEECGREIEPERFVAYQYETHCKRCAHD